MPTYTLTSIKTFRGTDGYGLNANLCCDGVKVAYVIDEGNGGCVNYEWLNWARGEGRVDVTVRDWKDENARRTYKGTRHEAAFQEYVLSLPKMAPCEYFPEGRYQDADGFIARLADMAEMDAKMKRLLKANLIFVCKGDKVGGFRTVSLKKAGTMQRALEYVAKKYPVGVTIVNNLPLEKQREILIAE